MKRSYSMFSSSSSSFSSRRTEYDVFLSFRGEDTRNNFTSHLYSALSQKGIYTFLDDDKLERGKSISPELLKAIENSRCSVIVLSENYASSSWCLDELVKILECREAFKQIVLPIFYHVDPSHVRKQIGSFGEPFHRYEQDFSQKVQKWRNALTQVASLAGWALHDGEQKWKPYLLKHEEVKIALLQNLVLEMRDGQTLNIGNLSNELRFLRWHEFPAKYLPSNFQRGGLELKLWLSKHLWNNAIKPLNNLKTIDISYSTNLRKFEDFGVVPNLEKLILVACVNLSEIHPSITLLERLTILNLKACNSLQNLPTSIGGLKSLNVLNLEGCVSLTDLPQDLGMATYLEQLILEDCRNLVEIPPPSDFLKGLLS
nr:disease resistance protein RPV1-like [Ziziphus jujuba var. spinosa]